MQPFNIMGDTRHKKPPPVGRSEQNTKTFRDEVHDVLARHKTLNRLSGRKKGDKGYLLASHADLADALGTSQRMIDKILGGVRAETKVRLTEYSNYIPMIRDLLGLRLTELAVPIDRAEVLAQIAGLSEKEFQPFREAIERRQDG